MSTPGHGHEHDRERPSALDEWDDLALDRPTERSRVRCRAQRAVHHRELERELAGIPRVESVDRWGPRATDHGHPQTTVIARATRWGSCPNAIVLAVMRQGLTIATVRPLEAGRVRVTIR